ncbi:hypothetical protein [Brucella sp. IR073]|uniref:hypothetical protein n=1 Tax=unclassified Brucella TaxID=2632610 RepID=UPI003B983A41
MIEHPSDLRPDDIFVLGNIAALAVRNGNGEQALPLLKLIQQARPENAGAFMLEAMYLAGNGERERAIALLEDIAFEQMKVNRDETIAFYLFLLQQDGQYERAAKLGHEHLDSGLIESPQMCESFRVLVSECEAGIASAKKHPVLGRKYGDQLCNITD